MIRDDVPFNTVLSADLVYVGTPGVVAAPYSQTDNNHYLALQNQQHRSVEPGEPARCSAVGAARRADHVDRGRRRDHHARRRRGVLLGGHQPPHVALHRDQLPVPRHGAAERHHAPGGLHPPGRDAQPGRRHRASSTTRASAVTSGMDALAGAFAYYQWDPDAMRMVFTRGQVQPKFLINANELPRRPRHHRRHAGGTCGASARTRRSAGAALSRPATALRAWASRSARAARSPSARSRRCSRASACTRRSPHADFDRGAEHRGSLRGHELQHEAGLRGDRRLLHGELADVDANMQSLSRRSSSPFAAAGCGGGGGGGDAGRDFGSCADQRPCTAASGTGGRASVSACPAAAAPRGRPRSRRASTRSRASTACSVTRARARASRTSRTPTRRRRSAPWSTTRRCSLLDPGALAARAASRGRHATSAGVTAPRTRHDDAGGDPAVGRRGRDRAAARSERSERDQPAGRDHERRPQLPERPARGERALPGRHDRATGSSRKAPARSPHDTGAGRPDMNLTLSGTYAWQSGGGVAFDGGRAMADPNDSKKLYNEIASGNGTQAVLDRGVGHSREHDAGLGREPGAHRVLREGRRSPQLHAGPGAVRLRRVQPQQRARSRS